MGDAARVTPCALVVMGVSGSGKSTIAEKLAERLGWIYEDGDSFHSAANVAKMHSGHPLTDEDRWPWLLVIAEWIDDYIAEIRFSNAAALGASTPPMLIPINASFSGSTPGRLSAKSTTGATTFSQSGRKVSRSRCTGPYCPGPSKANTL